MEQSELVIVYHRQPYEEIVVDGRRVLREHDSPNGIVPTLKSFFGSVEKCAWVAWRQTDPRRTQDVEPVIDINDSYGSYVVSRLPLSKEEVRSFYHVTSKEALWPILHSFPERYDYDPVDWATFREVNRKFANAAAAQAAPGAVVWVHDYNLWLMPGYLRALRPDVRIVFFHHTPFPAPNIFNILPWRDEIVSSLLTCDQISFHIPRYAASFVQVVRSLQPMEVLERIPAPEGMSACGQALSEPRMPSRIRHAGREIVIDAFPVGTDTDHIRSIALSEQTRTLEARIREELTGRRLIISVGRADYTKGTRDMLLAYQRLLERRLELHGKIQFMVTSVAANAGMTAYRNVQRDIEQLAGHINGRYASLGWQPLLFFTRATPFEELIAYYRCAEICWITPLRDGLNLVAKEFIAARHELGGTLVLSEFTGAAVELDGAVLTNPYSTRNMDAAIDQALDMPVSEQRKRMARLWKSVKRFNAKAWREHNQEAFARLRTLT